MDQSIKLNQCFSPLSIQNKSTNGIRTKANHVVDCDYCRLPPITQKHSNSNIASLNSAKEPCSMRHSFYVPENQQTIVESFCRQITSSVIPSSDPILSYCRPTDLQLTSNNNYVVSMSSIFQPLPFLLQSTSSSVVSVSSPQILLSSLSSFHNPYNVPSSVTAPMSLSNHPCPSYCSFSSHSLKPIPSVKPYLSSNHTYLESSRIMLDSVNSKSFNKTTTFNVPSITITTATVNTTATITNTTKDCAYHQSRQLYPPVLHHTSDDSLYNKDSKFTFIYPPTSNFSSPRTSTINENVDDNNNFSINSTAEQFPTSNLNVPQTCLLPSSSSSPLQSSLICRNSQASTISLDQLHNDNLNDNLSNSFKNDILIADISTSSSGTSCNSKINNDMNIDKKLSCLTTSNSSTSNTSESLNTDEKCNSLPRFNLRYTNVLQYPKYSTRKNSGFERRLKHTGLILDAKSTLHLLRKFLQPFVNRDFDQLIKKYMDDFILLAVNNIRGVLGEQSVTETDLNKFRQSLVRRVALRYFPERLTKNSINHQGTRNNSTPETGDNKPEKSDLIMQSKINSCTAPPSKWINSKPRSRIPTPDSLGSSLSFNNSPHLSPIPASDPISFDKSPQLNNDITDPTVVKTFRTVHSTLHNPISRNNESHYSLRNVSNHSSLGNVRKRLHPSNCSQTPVSYDTSKFNNNDNLLINTESFTNSDCDINGLQGKSASLPFSSHSPSSASSSSTVGFFHDSFSSDSEGTLISSSNVKLSEQTNAQINKSSTYEFHYSPSLLSSTTKTNSNVPIHKLKSKSSRSRKTPWWDRTRGKKSKSKVTNNNNNNTKYNEHHKDLIDEKNSLTQNRFINTLSNINIDEDLLHNTNQKIDANCNNTRKNTSSRLSRKKIITIKNTVNNFTIKNGNVIKFTFDQNTLFALGSSANTWLGMGTARGRIYSKHPELFRYICDNEDKAWLVQTGLIISHGVKAYLVHAEQVQQIARQQVNSYSSKVNIEKLRTFKLPHWFLQKVKSVASRHSSFTHIMSTELVESTNNETTKHKQNNSSLVDKQFTSSSSSFSTLSTSQSDIGQSKLDNLMTLSNPLEMNPYTTTSHHVKKIQHAPTTVSLSLSSSSSSASSKYSLATSSSIQEYHDTDHSQNSNNNNNNSQLNHHCTKSNRKSINYHSKTQSIDINDENSNNHLMDTIQSQPSPNPPTLERFDYTTNR
ncbi:unnamed protein product [Schistosoma turkestanicum]|nr:unnamed protein product [Schistosoma turkestanicum]